MGTVTISFEMTLDGVFDQMEHWFDVEDPELIRHSDELVFGADAVLLGRESYEFFREYWPAQTDERGFAAHTTRCRSSWRPRRCRARSTGTRR